MKKGYVMQEQYFSVNDGDGIRTTIFLAGCPLRCKWCSNPEGFSPNPSVLWYQNKCIECGKCADICPERIGINLNEDDARSKCISCGKCVEVCPFSARIMSVDIKDVKDVVDSVNKFSIFYRNSGGGITFSGGEATVQREFLDELSQELYDKGYDLNLETCGYFDFEKVKEILCRMNLIFMDIKHMNDSCHVKYTGVSNKPILENLKNLNKIPCDIVIRIPVIGGVNNDEENIRATAGYVHKHLPKAKMELLPYHNFGDIKYKALGMPLPSDEFYAPGQKEMYRLREIVSDEGVENISFR